MRRSTIQSLSAGQIDSALSSIATFIAGLYALRAFDAGLLGAYVVMFTAWNLARSLASELVFVPSEVVAVSLPSADRIHVLRSSVIRGTAVSLLGGAGVYAARLLIVDSAGAQASTALALSAVAVTILAPLQEHWRRMFHIAGSSWRAAIVSTLHLIVTVVSIIVLKALVHVAWVPLGCLAVGFAVSSVASWVLTHNLPTDGTDTQGQPTWPELIGIGKWLLLANTSAMGSDFLLAVIVDAAIGSEMLGYAEGARVIARPVVILGVGLAAVLGPRSVAAGLNSDLDRATRPRHAFWLVSTVAGVLYMLVVGWHWPLNPLQNILPLAYEVHWLIPLAIAGALVYNLAQPWWFEALGARRQRSAAMAETAGAVLKIATGFFAGTLQAFTLPVAWLLAWIVRAVGLGNTSASIFAHRKATEPAPSESSA
ncbi:MAG TPA: hypothetical protein VF246_05090 [Acidimicrobiia bacterium]